MTVMADRDNNWQKDLQFLLGDTAILEQLAEQKPYIPFSEETIDFLDALYQALRKENRSVQVADLAAFSFWCRKGNLSHIREQYARQWNGKRVIGRGVAFHIVPSNIPVLFAFSMAASLLAGDPVVLRAGERNGAGTDDFIGTQTGDGNTAGMEETNCDPSLWSCKRSYGCAFPALSGARDLGR